MYLKSIEVYGFKSFANKIIFEFQNGITGIVGPNGSGKSNVADAVRWVLGEQSAKQLRGSKMEDVIFSGTENRRPVGSAYVAITFDNRDKKLPVDYGEVTVARRVYRSGESEYILNGSACRRRDIVELFMDTGIGQEGYSIIGQGQIEKILSGKPEDRRELFDEAAGIVKYKKNKESAQKALEAEHLNLSRATDVLKELERQLGPLERQSKAAREYLSLRDKLRIKEAWHFVFQSGQLRALADELSGKLSLIREDLSEKKQKYDKIRREYEQTEAQIERLEREISDGTEEIYGSTLAAEKAKGQIQVLEEQIRTAKTGEEHKKSNEKRLLSSLEKKEEERSRLILEQEGLLSEQEELKARQAEEEGALLLIEERTKKLKKELGDIQEKIQALFGQSAQKEVSLNRYEVMEEQLSLKNSEAAKKSIEAGERAEQLKKELAQNRQKQEELGSRQGDAERQLSALLEKIEQNRAGEKKLNEQSRALAGQLNRDISKLETLRNMAERYDGYGSSIRKVIGQKPQNPGIKGVIADLIKVRQEYETAIETALGGSIQNIVTDTEDTAKKMIHFLKENRYGRATFLPLSAMRASSFKRMEALMEEGVIGLASDLVEAKEEYKNLISQLLGRILVVDHIDHAVRLARKYGYSFRMVTLEGESLSPGGAMTGGAFKNTSNLLGRAREMEELKAAIHSTREQLGIVKRQEKQKEEERQQLALKENWLREENQKLLLLQNQLSMEGDSLSGQLLGLEKEITGLNREKTDILAQIFSLKESKGEIRKEKEAFRLEAEELGAQEKQLAEAILAEESDEAKAQEELMQIHMGLTALEQKQAFFHENKGKLEGEIARSKEELQKEQRDSYEMKKHQEELSGQIVQLRMEIAHYREEEAEKEAKRAAHIEEKDRYLSKNKQFFADREELHKMISGLDKEEYRLKARKDKAELELEDLKQYMWEHYEMTLSDARNCQDRKDGESDKIIKEEIANLKKRMNSLGPVNVQSIEEYKDVLGRYEFLTGQCEDIKEAEGKLLRIIKELDEAMKKQFCEKFSEINAMFHKVFGELFGGGTGELALLEEDNLLETGIGITVQPPGKKLQNMMQLSGGEKALTAIALLFAIQNLKPSPFCLLDEIEAALDDSNVIRFADYLKKLAKDTQFIVITHRRGTMTSADMLYGITMQEKGVSALVSVDLIEKDLGR